MEYSTQLLLQTSMRRDQDGAFNAVDGLTSAIMDAGLGHSPVGIQVETALAAGTILTFNVRGGGDEDALSDIAAADLDPARNHVSDGSTAVSSYSILIEDSVGYFPLDPAVFHGCRFVQVVSSEDNSDAAFRLVSKPL